MSPRCSILMRTKNVDWVLHHTLSALRAQTVQDYELWIVDSGSTDRTLEIAATVEHQRIDIEPAEYFPGKVLNRAAAHARAEILVLWNSDAVPLRDDALEHLLGAFDDPNVQAAYARQLPRPDADPWVRREYAASFPEEGPPPEWIGLSFPLAAIRTAAWREHPFYTDAWGSEDTEWGLRARRRGARIAYVREALVMHSHDYTLAQGFGRRFVEGEADAFIHPDRPASLLRSALRAAKGAVEDLREAWRARQPRDAARGGARRVVDAIGYLRGNRHGVRRRDEGVGDPRLGARAVLRRHESLRSADDRQALRTLDGESR